MDSEIRRYIDDILAGRTVTTGEFSLTASPATTTTVTRIGVSRNSVVHLTPHNSSASYSAIQNVVPANGSFVVNHTSSALTRTFRYSFVTGNIL